MCQKRIHHHSLQCVIPPFMLESILLKGSAEQREIALRSYAVSTTLRTARAILSALPSPTIALTPSGTVPGPQRTIYDAHHKEQLPGTVVRTEGQDSTDDPAVDEAYEYLGKTFDFYWESYQRNSVDNNGLPLRGSVHYGEKYANAFWNGTQMVFGDGDGHFFNRFTIASDVVAHELTHGVTQTDANLIYLDQSGALNESISDVFGSLVKQFIKNQTAEEADWLIGQGMFTKNVQGKALRSMKAPGTAFDDPVLGKDPQPQNMKDYNPTRADNGGVHINSGIPNHAFYLVATALKGYAWEKAGRIWYYTLHDRVLPPNTNFQAFAQATAITASQFYGKGSTEELAVKDAWEQVGIALAPVAKQVAVAGSYNGKDLQKIRQKLKELDELVGLGQ